MSAEHTEHKSFNRELNNVFVQFAHQKSTIFYMCAVAFVSLPSSLVHLLVCNLIKALTQIAYTKHCLRERAQCRHICAYISIYICAVF